MKIAFIIYDGLTLLDFAGFYDPVTRLKTMGFVNDLEYGVCALKDKITAFEGIDILPNKVKNDLKVYDYIFIPGGNSIMNLITDNNFMTWIRNVADKAVMVAVCGGALILGAAGFLKGKKATTHPMLMAYLKKFTEQISDSRIVDEGRVITARGVTSAIDLGLYLCEKIAGTEIREKIQKQMDYSAYTVE